MIGKVQKAVGPRDRLFDATPKLAELMRAGGIAYGPYPHCRVTTTTRVVGFTDLYVQPSPEAHPRYAMRTCSAHDWQTAFRTSYAGRLAAADALLAGRLAAPHALPAGRRAGPDALLAGRRAAPGLEFGLEFGLEVKFKGLEFGLRHSRPSVS